MEPALPTEGVGNDILAAQVEKVPLSWLAAYFLRLGTTGFGGPIALVGYMQRDLVEERGWVSNDDYLQGLAFSQLSPGPLAAQLANYLGWVHSGIPGATLTGIAFVLPSFLMVLALAAVYVHFGQLAWIQGMFYGIGAAVSAVIFRSAWKLVQRTLAADYVLWILFTVSAITTLWTGSEIVWLFHSVRVDRDVDQSSSKIFGPCLGRFLGPGSDGNGCTRLDEDSGDNLSFLPQGWRICLR
jgi:chromate transporter